MSKLRNKFYSTDFWKMDIYLSAIYIIAHVILYYYRSSLYQGTADNDYYT